MNTIEARDRGERANRIINDDLFLEAEQRLRASILQAFERSRPEDVQARERAYLELTLLNRLIGDFKSLIASGTLAARNINEARK